MELTTQILEEAASAGSQKVAEAMTTLVGSVVDVATSKVEQVPFKEALEMLSGGGDYAVVVYSTVDSPAFQPGVAILTMSRIDSLSLIDVLNKKPSGTTSLMKDVDRSAIKETLNILSNSYINELSKFSETEIRVEAPNMITVIRLQKLLETAFAWGNGHFKDLAIVFETTLTVTEHKIKVGLFLLFHEEFTKLIKSVG
ncbi:MAG: hypothetical protein V1716_01610 [Candidatus Uhrbacteria bacterium]